MTPEEEAELRQELLMADLNLRRKQDTWENPRNIAILLGAVAALVATVAGLAGYKFGSTPSNPPTVIIQFPPSLAPQLGPPTVVTPSK